MNLVTSDVVDEQTILIASLEYAVRFALVALENAQPLLADDEESPDAYWDCVNAIAMLKKQLQESQW